MLRNLCLLVILLLSQIERANAKPNPVNLWNGEYLSNNEAAAFVRVKLRGFKRSNRGNFFTGDIVFTLTNTKQQKDYTFSQGIQGKGQPKTIWRFPAGTYFIKRISLIDNAGRTLIYGGNTSKIFYLKALHLSNLGYWTISPGKNSKLQIKIAEYKANYKHRFDHQSFVAVIDGLSGRVQKILGGNKILKAAKDNFGSQNEARATFTQTRQIGMFYQINLGANNRYAKTILKTMQNQDLTFRNCFLDALERTPNLQGKASFIIQIGKKGVVEQVKKGQGSIKDKDMLQCLYYNLGAMQFPLSRKIKGSITFIFKTY